MPVSPISRWSSRFRHWPAALGLYAALATQATAAPAQLPDSQRILRSARAAQADFESTRRYNLPTAFGHGRAACDEQIGRFCYWYDDGDEPLRAPPPESAGITRARERLRATLVVARPAALRPPRQRPAYRAPGPRHHGAHRAGRPVDLRRSLERRLARGDPAVRVAVVLDAGGAQRPGRLRGSAHHGPRAAARVSLPAGCSRVRRSRQLDRG